VSEFEELRAKIAAVDAMPFSDAWKSANEELGFTMVRAMPTILDMIDNLEAALVKIAETCTPFSGCDLADGAAVRAGSVARAALRSRSAL
jgi:hypothetical protein